MKKFKWIPIVIVLAILASCSDSGSTDNNETTRLVNVENHTVETTTYADVKETTENIESENKETETTKKTIKSKNKKSQTTKKTTKTIELKDIPNYTGSPYTIINDNEPVFSKDEITTSSYESFSYLDSLGRCGVVMACVGQDIMPTEERGSIGHIRPSGWQTVKYDIVDGKYLYNRCHLLGFQLTGENDNERNLITGTRYFNVEGMLPFENLVADYVKETDNHVMYRVTPLYKGDELVARGVLMEGYSVEDDGAGVSFNVYCYNVQPGIEIDYANGKSKLDSEVETEPETTKKKEKTTKKTISSNKTEYILNMNSYKFHYPSCYSVDQMSESNKGYYEGSREDLIAEGYDPCGNCNP